MAALNTSCFEKPTDAYPQGFTTIGNYNVLPGDVTSTAYDNNKILRVFCNRREVRRSSNTPTWRAHIITITRTTITPAPHGWRPLGLELRGHADALSAMIEYRPSKRLDLYAGGSRSQVTGGMASGYLYHQNFGPTAGLRFQF